ncbi:hypothetical protein [Shimia sp. MIT1388]|uniref:hypothetical protein n=1 Tax=Shimia sp. MIT1388 TaxID=3096992 RepID=UPI00399B83CD
MQLPEPREFGWELKSFDNAHSTVTHLPDGRTLFEVDHPPVRDVTAEMLSWWYGVYADLTLVIDGDTYPAFLVSHPQDHISLDSEKAVPDGPLKAGDFLNIQEAYQRNPKFALDERLEVVALDAQRFALKATRRGVTVADLEFRFEDGPDGAKFTNLLTVGVESGWLKPLVNRVMIPWLYYEDKNYAWVLHTVEEVGNFENFLPEIFARRDQGMTIRWNRNSLADNEDRAPEG